MAELPTAGDTVAIHIADVALDVELDGTDGNVDDAGPDAVPDTTNTELAAIPPFAGPNSTTESKGTVCDAADNGNAPGAGGATGDDDSFDESGLLPPVQASLGFRTATAPPTMGAQSRKSSGAEDGGGESKGVEAATEGEVAAAAAMPPPAPLLLRSASDRPAPTEVDPSVKQAVREAKQRFRVGGIGVPRNQFTRFITKNRPLPALRMRMLASIGVRKADDVR
jgi:hypothetical protein